MDQLEKEIKKVDSDGLTYNLSFFDCFRIYPKQSKTRNFGIQTYDDKIRPTKKFYKYASVAISGILLTYSLGSYMIDSIKKDNISSKNTNISKKVKKNKIRYTSEIKEVLNNLSKKEIKKYKLEKYLEESKKIKNSKIIIKPVEKIVKKIEPKKNKFNPNLKYKQLPVFVDMNNDGVLEEYLVKVEDRGSSYGKRFYFDKSGRRISNIIQSELENKLEEPFNLYANNLTKFKTYFDNKKYTNSEKDKILTSVIENRTFLNKYSSEASMFNEYKVLASILGL